MSFEDTGGKKQINLSLRTADDINLEKIILNSLMKPVEIFNDYIKNSNLEEEDPENIVKTSNYRIANFRIRFGYSDTPLQDDTAINEKEIASPGFSRRTENTKPVIKSPWLYFLINKLETDFVSLETSFEIGGLNVGSYMLDEFRIYNKIPYDSLTQVTARKAIGILSKILFESSNGTICVLGEEKDSIVFDYDNSSSGELSLKKIKTKGSDNSLGVSYFDFDPFYVEVLQEGKIKGVETKTFEIKEEKDEDGNKNIPTARKLLDSLSDFLPTKLYGVPKLDGGNKIAFEVMKSKESIIKDYAKELKISYDLIECEAEILDKFGNIDKKYGSNKRRTFIRFYYKGPISRDIPSSEKIRFYKYRGIKDSIVKSFRVENPMNFQKIYGVIGSFESYESALFYTSKISSKILSSGGFIGNKKKLNIKDYSGSIFIPKDDIKHEDVPLVDPKVGTNSISLNKISEISNSLSRYVYEGELEIVGDPYFIFDDDLEPWRNMIYLKVNRYENIKNEKLADNDYYSGLYMIKKINHEISSDGDFITRLNIVKFTMAEKEE
jgi:hypothetical protein